MRAVFTFTFKQQCRAAPGSEFYGDNMAENIKGEEREGGQGPRTGTGQGQGQKENVWLFWTFGD